ncbi:MAG: RNA polymerase sigma factor, partial [Myxococcota bacterium]
RRVRHLLTAPLPAADSDALLRQKLLDALDTLTPAQREVFVLVRLNGMSLDDAASVMECAQGTAKSHLHRATERLKKKLKSAYGELK